MRIIQIGENKLPPWIEYQEEWWKLCDINKKHLSQLGISDWELYSYVFSKKFPYLKEAFYSTQNTKDFADTITEFVKYVNFSKDLKNYNRTISINKLRELMLKNKDEDLKKAFDDGNVEIFATTLKKILQRNSLRSWKGNKRIRTIFEYESKPQSWHESVVMDVFKICGVSVEYEPKIDECESEEMKKFIENIIDLSDSHFGEDSTTYKVWLPVPDFRLPDGYYFEIFGLDSAEYLNKQVFKIRHIPKLKWIDHKDLSDIHKRRTLFSYAEVLDTRVKKNDYMANPSLNSINQDLSSGNLLDGVSFTESLLEKIPLLQEHGIDISFNYVEMTKSFVEEKPVLPFPKTSSVKTAQNNLLGIDEIENNLKGMGFLTPHLWSDEEKVAVYFKTPQSLEEYIQHETLEKAAFNLYRFKKWKM